MRFIFFWQDTPHFWAGLALVLAVVIGVVLYHWLWPPRWEALLKDGRYRQALAVYGGSLPPEEPTDDERHQAQAAAVEYLIKEHGVPPGEAGRDFRQVRARFDRERSYELRREAQTYEQVGAYELALEHYRRAARWQKEHDPKDYQFLQECAARVRRKMCPR